MQVVPAFHNGFLTGYKPAPTNYRSIVTNIVRMAACLLLLASVSMQSYAPPAPAIDYTLSQHQPRPSTQGLTLGEMTDEQLEDSLMDAYDEERAINNRIGKLLDQLQPVLEHAENIQSVQESRRKCRAGDKDYCFSQRQ